MKFTCRFSGNLSCISAGQTTVSIVKQVFAAIKCCCFSILNFSRGYFLYIFDTVK